QLGQTAQDGNQRTGHKMLCVPCRETIPSQELSPREQIPSPLPSPPHTHLSSVTHPHSQPHLGSCRCPGWSRQQLHLGAQRVLLRGSESWGTHTLVPMSLLRGPCHVLPAVPLPSS
uniref:Uncharacterized protein n=1 Tax=Anas zonorhyncha TaxID=75864 RepID=A0A8B9UVH8_9AVES